MIMLQELRTAEGDRVFGWRDSDKRELIPISGEFFWKTWEDFKDAYIHCKNPPAGLDDLGSLESMFHHRLNFINE